ncbi:MAG TPA: amidohydrolase [Salinimicrobium sp.]|nr:amidohydrolase [Salinimicrobium sp.]
MSKKLFIRNVRLETGFTMDQNGFTRTQTELFDIEMVDGKIVSVNQGSDISPGKEIKAFLMLPAMKDMHIHLDKTFYGGPWLAPPAGKRTVKEMIELEKKLLPDFLEHTSERAEKIFDLLISRGTDFIRGHVNIEPVSNLKGLKKVQQAIESYKDCFSSELVAFPQHGVYYSSGSADLMKDAAQMDIDYIGGLDPCSIDGNMERTVDFTVQLALDHNKGIDMHLHETGESGLNTVKYLIDRVNENPELKGKTFLSHCYILGKLEEKDLSSISEQISQAQIGIVSTIPLGELTMPIPFLLSHGVRVLTGSDSIYDHWDPFGTGSMLEKANLMARLYDFNSEKALSQCLKIATGGLLPLNEKGDKVWPKPGDEASFTLVDASCSAEAVARVSRVKKLFHKGEAVWSELPFNDKQ